MNLSELLDFIVCPVCKSEISLVTESKLVCSVCSATFSIKDGIPILISERSKHDLERFWQDPLHDQLCEGKASAPRRFFRFMTEKIDIAPAPKINNARNEAIKKVALATLSGRLNPRILIIGNFMPTNGKPTNEHLEIANLYQDAIRLDIIKREATNIIADGHFLPFPEGFFHLVIAQAVIKHLRNPYTFVEEINRVLTNDGLFYMESPFLLTFHRWPGDYVRFTPLGVKELLNDFTVVESGLLRGPSQTVADILSIYLASLFSFNIRYCYSVLIRLFSWLLHPLKFLDRLLNNSHWADLLEQVRYYIAKKC